MQLRGIGRLRVRLVLGWCMVEIGWSCVVLSSSVVMGWCMVEIAA